MTQGRKPLSVEQLKLRGTYQKCRHDKRQKYSLDELPDVGNPPDHITDEQAVIWQELRADSVPGVLRMSDRVMLEITCNLLDTYRQGDASNAHIQLLVKNLSALGFAPTERHRLGVKLDEEPEEEFLMLNS